MSTTFDFGGSGSSAYDGMCGNCQGAGCGHCGQTGEVHAKQPPAPVGNGDALGAAGNAYLGDEGSGWAQPGIGSGLDTGMAE